MIVNRTRLLGLLSKVKVAIASQEFVEQSTCFIFKGGRIFAYNDEIAVSTKADIDEEIVGAVSAKELVNLLGRVKEEEITVKATDTELNIISGRTKAGILLQKEITLPIDELGIPKKWSPLPPDFDYAISECEYSCGKDMTKPALTCIHLNEDKAESCDADFRLTRYTFKKKYFKTPILIPGKSAMEISKYGFDKYSTTQGWVHFQHKEDDLVFSTRVFDTKYPKLDEFLKVEGVEIKIPKELGDCLDRCSIFAETSLKRDELVKIDISKGRISLKAQNEQGWIKDSCRMKYKGKPISFLVNPKVLMGSIKNMESAIIGERNMKFKGENFDHLVALMIKEE